MKNKAKKSKNLSMTARVTLIFAMVMLVMLVASNLLVYSYSQKKTAGYVTDSVKMVTQNNTHNVEDSFARIETAVSLINSEQSGMARLLNEFDGEMIQGVKDHNKAVSQLSNSMDITLSHLTPQYSAYLFVDPSMKLSAILPTAYKDGIASDLYNGMSFVDNQKGITDTAWYQKAVAQNGVGYWFVNPEDDHAIYYTRQLRQIVVESGSAWTRTMGVILIRMDASWIANRIDTTNLTAGTKIYLLNADDNLLYGNSPLSVPEQKEIDALYEAQHGKGDAASFWGVYAVAGQQNFVQYTKMENDLRLITLVPAYDIRWLTYNVSRIILMIGAVAAISGVMMVLILSKKIVAPIRRLSEHMAGSGNLTKIEADKVPQDEIGALYRNFNLLIERENKLNAEKYQALKQREEAELKALQAQVNPHFLYNTLDSVCCMALIRQEDEMAEALSALADILRYNIREPDAIVPLSSELKIVENYIQIQKLRYGKRLCMAYDFDVELETVSLPKMLIQPLVENAIAYGADPATGVVSILLSCFYDNNNLMITVTDQGQCDRLDQLNAYLVGKGTLSASNTGFGIRNVNQRIHWRFGEDYGLQYRHSPEGGTQAVLCLPRFTQGADHQRTGAENSAGEQDGK